LTILLNINKSTIKYLFVLFIHCSFFSVTQTVRRYKQFITLENIDLDSAPTAITIAVNTSVKLI